MTKIEEQILQNQIVMMQAFEKCLIMDNFWQIKLNTQAFETAKLIKNEKMQEYYGQGEIKHD